MKKDVLLVAGVVIILIITVKSIFQIKMIFKIIIGLLIFGLFLYRQLKPYKNILYPKYQKRFTYIEYIYDWLFKLLRLKPVQLGNKLSIDVTSLLLLIIFIILLIL
jgi:hypothetical protein